MAGKRELKVTILGDATGAKKAFGEVESASGGVGSKMAAFGKTAVFAMAGAATAASAFGVKAVMAASDLNETMSKTQVVFGEATKQVTAFADDMAKKFGTPKKEVLDAAAAIGLIGKASGLAQPAAAKMSTDLAKLAADASSFYNVPLDEALDAIKSGLVGEAEPMRRFGVLLNEDAVAAEAMRLGLVKNKKELTEGAKAQARASLILNGMKDATGDLERSQGSFSNRLRELQGRAANFAASVGTHLLPIVLRAMDAFEKIAGVVSSKLAPAIDMGRRLFGAFWDAGFGGEGVTSDGVFGLFERLGVVASDVFSAIQLMISKFGSIWNDPDITSDGWFGVFETVVLYARHAFDAIQVAVSTFVVFFEAEVLPRATAVLQWLAGELAKMAAFWATIWPQIQEVVRHVVNVLVGIWQRWGDEFLAIARNVYAVLKTVVENGLTIIREVITLALSLINGEWGKAWDALKNIVATLFETIGVLLYNGLEALGQVFQIIIEAFGELGENIVKAIAAGIRKAPGAIVDALGDVLGGAGGAVGGALTGVVPGIGLLPKFHNGGVFRAPSPGGDGLAVLRDGERVLTPGQSAGGGMSITINMPPGSDGEDVVAAIQRWVRRNGPLPSGLTA